MKNTLLNSLTKFKVIRKQIFPQSQDTQCKKENDSNKKQHKRHDNVKGNVTQQGDSNLILLNNVVKYFAEL